MRAPFLVTILYEDQDSKGNKDGFGLHELVLTYAAERYGLDRYRELRPRINPVPCKGNDKVLRNCWENMDTLCSPVIIAVLDSDRIRTQPRLSKRVGLNSSDEDVIEAIRAGYPESERGRLRIVLLKENMETLLRVVERCDPAASRVTLERALNKKLLDRDALLNALAKDPGKGQVRECIWNSTPWLQELVQHVESAYRSQGAHS